jgi:valyl-tRNA synthetase
MSDVDPRLLKPYDPPATEKKIYKLWEESGFFNPDNLPGKVDKPFTIVMPPPNATGVLHMGHALMLTLEDIMIRYKRMRGYKTLWLPGTDHAAIATQSKVEKEIQKKESKNRHDLGREELLKRIQDFVEENRSIMTRQMRVMGASCDWSREAFTLDEARSLAVRTVFKKMYNDGIIYRGHRIVNWDPKGQTVISDDEIVYEERKAKLYSNIPKTSLYLSPPLGRRPKSETLPWRSTQTTRVIKNLWAKPIIYLISAACRSKLK